MQKRMENPSQDDRQSLAEALDCVFGANFEPTEALRRKLVREEANKQLTLEDAIRRAA